MRCVTIVLNGDDLRGLLVLITTGATAVGRDDLSLELPELSLEDNELPEFLLDDDDTEEVVYPIRPNGG